MFLPAHKLQGPIAIDIGSAGVRALQMERRHGTLTVRHWACLSAVESASRTAPRPATQRHEDDPAHRPEPSPAGEAPVVAETTDAAAAQVSSARAAPPQLDLDAFTGNEVVVAISPPEIECTPLRVPDNLLKLERKTLLAAIRHEVSRNISLPIDSVEMDIWRLVPGHLDSPNIMVAAARREVIARTLEWLDNQRLVCRRIDAGPLAVVRACTRAAGKSAADHLWGVLDVGRSAVRLYLSLGHTPVYVRCMGRGGDEMTRRISEELGVGVPVAESYKRHYGVHASTTANGSGASGGDGHYRPMTTADDAVDSRRMAGILLGVLRPIIRSVGEEVQRSFRYAMGLYPDRPIGGLWLVGQGSNMAGLAEMLGEMLGIEVHRLHAADMAAGLSFPPGLTDEALPQLAACVGLCLENVVTKVQVNLLPASYELRYQRGRRLRRWIAVGVAVAVVQVAAAVTLRQMAGPAREMKHGLAAAEQQQREMAKRIDDLGSQETEVEREIQLAEQLNRKHRWSELLAELTRSMPDTVVLTRLESDPAKAGLIAGPVMAVAGPVGKNAPAAGPTDVASGLVISGVAVDQGSVTAFLRNLNARGRVGHCLIDSTMRQPYLTGEGVMFTIKTRW